MLIEHMQQKSKMVRAGILNSVKAANGGHLGGGLSVTDILVALYYDHLKFRVGDPFWEQRDRFILSKGHCCLPLYHILADVGLIPREWISSYCAPDGRLAGHVEHTVPGIEVTSGSLGHGPGVAVGMAYAAKRLGRDWHVYVVLGDGECNEGSVWESFMAAAQWRLNNLHFIIDYNKQESLDHIDNIMSLEPLADRCASFGLESKEIDGHDLAQLSSYFSGLRNATSPTMLIAHTVKGKGVSFMEGVYKWHHSKMDDEQFHVALGDVRDA